MSHEAVEEPLERCAAEIQMASEFPEWYDSFRTHPASRPNRPEIWERVLSYARNSKPILADVRARGLSLYRLDQYTGPAVDLSPRNQTILEWLPKIQDPLTFTICLSVLGGSERSNLKKSRKLLLSLAREWNERWRLDDKEHSLSFLAQSLATVVLESDLPEILSWARDIGLATSARARYVFNLKRFARKPGLAREALFEFVTDKDVGSMAVWALAEVLKGEALPVLRELKQTAATEDVRKAAAETVKKLESRMQRVNLPKVHPSRMPKDFVSTAIEMDTDRVPEVLLAVERGLKASLQPGVREQLALSASQIKRGRERFYIVDLSFQDGSEGKLGLGLYAEDEDVTLLTFYLDARHLSVVENSFRSF